MLNKLIAFHTYWSTHAKQTLIATWVAFFVTLAYMLLCIFVFSYLDGWKFGYYWFWVIGGAFALYFRVTWGKASYDPRKDRWSDEYVPRKERLQQDREAKAAKKAAKKKH